MPAPQTTERNLTWVALRKLAGVRGPLSTLIPECRHRMSKWLTQNHPISLPSTQGIWPSSLSSFHPNSRSQIVQAGGICFSKLEHNYQPQKLPELRGIPPLALSLSKLPFREPGDLEVTYFLYEVRGPRTRSVYKNCKIQVSQHSSKGCHSPRVYFGNFSKQAFASKKHVCFFFPRLVYKSHRKKFLRRKVYFNVV